MSACSRVGLCQRESARAAEPRRSELNLFYFVVMSSRQPSAQGSAPVCASAAGRSGAALNGSQVER